MAKSQMLFYKHEQHIIPDNSTRYEQKLPHSFLRYHNKHSKVYEKIPIISQIWHRVKMYFTCISSPWYLIMVPNMKEIHPAIMEECTRMVRQTDGLTCQTDGKTDKQIDRRDPSAYSPIPVRLNRE